MATTMEVTVTAIVFDSESSHFFHIELRATTAVVLLVEVVFLGGMLASRINWRRLATRMMGRRAQHFIE